MPTPSKSVDLGIAGPASLIVALALAGTTIYGFVNALLASAFPALLLALPSLLIAAAFESNRHAALGRPWRAIALGIQVVYLGRASLALLLANFIAESGRQDLGASQLWLWVVGVGLLIAGGVALFGALRAYLPSVLGRT
jgi:hypothetical protein